MNEQRQLTKAELLLFQTHFSRREVQVLLCVLAGKTSREAAEELKIAPKTVHAHREHIYDKIEMSSFHGVCTKVERRSIPALVWFATITGLAGDTD